MRAFPARVALALSSTELGEVNICLKACSMFSQRNSGRSTIIRCLPSPEDGCGAALSKDPDDRIVGRDKALAANNPPLPEVHR